jgi:hypothetical protein
MLAKAKAEAKAKVKHIYGTGIIYDRHLRSSKYIYNTGNWFLWLSKPVRKKEATAIQLTALSSALGTASAAMMAKTAKEMIMAAFMLTRGMERIKWLKTRRCFLHFIGGEEQINCFLCNSHVLSLNCCCLIKVHQQRMISGCGFSSGLYYKHVTIVNDDSSIDS